MLNLTLGTASDLAGRSVLTTRRKSVGHAVYGPYEFRDAGAYSVEFHLALPEGETVRGDPVCATLDVVRDNGSDVLETRRIRVSELGTQLKAFRLDFTITRRSKLEYRIAVSGAVALVLDGQRRVSAGQDDFDTCAGYRPFSDFPGPDADLPPFFARHHAQLHDFHQRGFDVGLVGEDVVLRRDGIAFYARVDDDFMFVGEVFGENVYNFVTNGPACVVDIGMNIGFSTLQFARKPFVEEVHSFEPIPSTYNRAVDNIALNPSLATKIRHHRVGLSDNAWSGEMMVNGDHPSGSQTVVADSGDHAVAVELVDAGDQLRPVLDALRADVRVVLKIDCEGSEFAIIRSLERADLLGRIDAVMVEWHAMFDTLNQTDLIDPLLKAGFIVFDRSPPAGNGFFYAVRLGAR